MTPDDLRDQEAGITHRGMRYEAGGTPTEYAGIRYRSKMEARWGAFFAGAKWNVAYEPYRVGRWLPDFVVTFTSGTRYFMEAKPLLSIETWLPHDYLPKHLVTGKDRVALLGQGILDGDQVLHKRPTMRRRAVALQRKTIESRHKQLQLGWLWDPQDGAWKPWFPKPEGLFATYHVWIRAQSQVSVDDHFVLENRTVDSLAIAVT